MKIIIPIKQVPDTRTVRLDETTGTVIRQGVASIVNPLDLYAIELAVQLKQQHPAELIALTMGPDNAEHALREAVAMGVDTGILLSDPAFRGSDTWATSLVLASAIRRVGDCDLVLCGERATDGDTGQVGPEIAAFLALPIATYVTRCEISPTGHCQLTRLVEDGYETISGQLPLVLTVVKEISNPRLPSLHGKRTARTAPITRWNHQDLGLDPDQLGLTGSPTRVLRVTRPSLNRSCRLIHAKNAAGIAQATDAVTAFLADNEGSDSS